MIREKKVKEEKQCWVPQDREYGVEMVSYTIILL